jgi:HSP20 family protein
MTMKLFHHKTEDTVDPVAPMTEPATPEATDAEAAMTTEAVTPTETSPAPRWPTISQWFDSAFAAVDPIHIEERRDEDGLVIRAELPGIDPEKDVELTVSHGMLRIHGERREESQHDDEAGFRSELRYGAFTRVLPLPAGASESDVKATYEDGFLEVRIPVDAETAAARKVPVTAR